MSKKYKIKDNVKKQYESNNHFAISFCPNQKLTKTKNNKNKFGLSGLEVENWNILINFMEKHLNNRKLFDDKVRSSKEEDENENIILHYMVTKKFRIHGYFDDTSTFFKITKIDPNHNVHD